MNISGYSRLLLPYFFVFLFFLCEKNYSIGKFGWGMKGQGIESIE
jgi:hypothetical protein